MRKISFVIPCYCSQNMLKLVTNEIENVMSGETKYDYEIILVNDCSPDNTFDIICHQKMKKLLV